MVYNCQINVYCVIKLTLISVCAAPIAKLDDYNCNSLSDESKIT